MAENEDWQDKIVKFGVFLGALWLGTEYLRSISKLTCPYCGAKILTTDKNCPKCKSRLPRRGDF